MLTAINRLMRYRFIRYPSLLIAYLIAFPICKFKYFQNYKLHLLSSWYHAERRNILDNILFPLVLTYWFKFEYLKESDPDKREALKELLMGGESGRLWAGYYNEQPLDFRARVGAISFGTAYPVLPYLHDKLSSLSDTATIIQVGSSSGREVAWLAEKYPRHLFVGTDIYAEVISFSSEQHKLSNLTFTVSSAKSISNIIKSYSGEIIVFSSGSLQYVQPEHLQLFFDSLACYSGIEIELLEPGNDSEGDPTLLTGSRWRGNFSYTHNYKYYAERAGFETTVCEIIKPYASDKISPHRNTIHYFYVCKSKRCHHALQK